MIVVLHLPEGPSTQYLRALAPKTIPLKVSGTRVLEYWVLGLSGPYIGPWNQNMRWFYAYTPYILNTMHTICSMPCPTYHIRIIRCLCGLLGSTSEECMPKFWEAEQQLLKDLISGFGAPDRSKSHRRPGSPRGSKYPIFKDSGPKNHTLNGF